MPSICKFVQCFGLFICVRERKAVMGQGSSSCPLSFSGSDHSHWPVTASSRGSVTDLTLILPDECLAMVLGRLCCHDRNSCSLVCRRWNLIDSKSRQRLHLVARSEMSPYFSSLLSRFNSISALSLKSSRKVVSINDDALASIPVFLPFIRKLKLKGCINISDNGLHALSLHHPPLLVKVSFASCGFGPKGLLSLLVNCPSVQDLTLKRLSKLDAQNTPLSLDNYVHSSAQGHENIDKQCSNNSMHRLERLCIKDLHNARLFIPLVGCYGKTLRTLIVCRSSGNWDPVLESLHGITTSITEIHMENVQMGDAGLVSISSSCPDLQTLYISRATDCTDDGLSAIFSGCKQIRKLHVDAWSRFGSKTIGDATILSIATRCFQLQEMVLMGIQVTVASLDLLSSNCQALERMALCNTDSVGDLEMTLIGAKFSALKKLCIKNCPISDSGIQAIVDGCPSLVKLKVKRCRRVRQVCASELRMQRSSLAVSVDAGSMLFDPREDELEEDGRMPTSALPNTTNTRTHVICSSRSALVLKSKFGNALQLNRRRSHARYSSA